MNIEIKEKLTKYIGLRDESFKRMIEKLLRDARIKPHYIEKILDNDSMKEYHKAFTSLTVTSFYNQTTGKVEIDDSSSENYEVYEKLGDGVFDNFIGWYAYRRFGEDNKAKQVKLLHIIRSKYGSKHEFAPISESLGFWPYISANMYERNHNKKKLLEDVFEAFLGATSYILDKKFMKGVGYAICYDMLSSIFDKIEIKTEFETMLDYVSKLNQLFMKYKELGKIKYADERVDKISYVYVYQVIGGVERLIGKGNGMIKKDAKQNASKNTLESLEKIGYKM